MQTVSTNPASAMKFKLDLFCNMIIYAMYIVRRTKHQNLYMCVSFPAQDHRSIYDTEQMLAVPNRDEDDAFSDSQASVTTITAPVIMKQ